MTRFKKETANMTEVGSPKASFNCKAYVMKSSDYLSLRYGARSL